MSPSRVVGAHPLPLPDGAGPPPAWPVFPTGPWAIWTIPIPPGFVTVIVVPALELTTPTLFLGGLVGLYSWLGGGGDRLTRTGLVVGMFGTVLGVVQGLNRWQTLQYLENWLTPLFAGLAVVGVATLVFKNARRLLGAIVLASATLGWVSLLTDPAFPAVLVPTRAVHVGFAALFCMSTIAWGWALFRRSP